MLLIESCASSKPNLITCPRKEKLLRFQSNSTVTSDCCEQSLETTTGTILNQLQSKFVAKLVANEM